MIIIGEKINATRKSIAAALEARDEGHVIRTATEQVTAGADYLDVNGGDPREGREEANMAWLVELVDNAVPARNVYVIDAAKGDMVDVLDRLYVGRNRETYDANHGTSLPGTLVRSEGDGPTGDQDVDNAHDFAECFGRRVNLGANLECGFRGESKLLYQIRNSDEALVDHEVGTLCLFQEPLVRIGVTGKDEGESVPIQPVAD